MSRIRHIFCLLAAMTLATGLTLAQDSTVHRYSGALSREKAGEDLVLRQFEVLVLQSPSGNFFSVLDDEREGCPWPESYGQLMAAGAPEPHVLYRYDGNPYSLILPPLVLDVPDDVTEGSNWTQDTWTFEVQTKEKVDGRAAWKIQARERRGRRQTLVVDADSETLLDAQQDVFMGQGERFELILRRTSGQSVASNVSERLDQLQSELLSLQSGLKRRPDSQLAELTPRQVEDAQSRVGGLTSLAKDTPLQETVLRIRQDVERQQRRVAQTMKREEQLLNRAGPSFSLNLVTDGTLDSESLKRKTVVLHFWKYSEKPLSEPYGQVGYLEFLYNKRKQNGVEVVGVAMNPLLQQADTVRAERRSARKLIEFMNLSYPVGYDDGSLLRALGDPRDAGGELPLWVVISPGGQIVHYHGGFYEVDQRQGLKDLDDILIEQIRSASE